MKKIISLVLSLSIIITGSLISNAYAFTDVLSLNSSDLYSEQSIKELEIEAGIETKQDSEVFLIRQNEERHEIYFVEQDQKLTIIPMIDEDNMLSKDSSSLVSILTQLNNGYKVSTREKPCKEI